MSIKRPHIEDQSDLFSSPSKNYSNNPTPEGLSNFEVFLAKLRKEKERLDNRNISANYQASVPLDVKVDEFLLKHAGLDYKQLLNMVKPETFNENSYALFSSEKMKVKLFNKKAKLYIAALYDYEQEGRPLEEVIELIRENEIPYLKKSAGKELTFEAIYPYLIR